MARSHLQFILLATLTFIGAVLTEKPNIPTVPVPILTSSNIQGIPETTSHPTISDITTNIIEVTTKTTETPETAPTVTTTSNNTKTTTTTTSTTPTTTTSTTPTTTSTTTTTTKAPPTPPAPLPAPAKGKWVYSEKNVTCIVMEMAVQINVTYLTKDQNVSHAVFNLPVDNTTLVVGSCGNNTQLLSLMWMSTEKMNNSLTLQFQKNSTTKHYTMSGLDLVIQQDSELFPNAANNKSTEYMGKEDSFSVPLSSYYRCARAQHFNLTSAKNESVIAATITITDLKEQAFRKDSGHEFSAGVVDCEPMDVPDVVPIAVGCALAALVLVVLAAYLIGRRRSQARGYLSM